MTKNVLAFDFGASSGRGIIGSFDGSRLGLTEIHRFSNDPVEILGTLHWDSLRHFHEIKQGLLKAKEFGFDSVGIDTWGVDFGLIDAEGRLLENPVHYRDKRTAGILEKTFEKIPARELYEMTGVQFMEFNTLFQLLVLMETRPELMERAERFLMMPNLYNYFLCGEKQVDFSVASTTQMMDPRTGDWNKELLGRLGIPESLCCEIRDSGTTAGMLLPAIREELGLPETKIINIAAHDTASAIAAVPAREKDFLYISSGTWSIMGIESPVPIISETSFAHNMANEGGYGRVTRFLKNIMGLWLIQESRRQWLREGQNVSYADLEREALASPAFACFVDVDDLRLMRPGDMPARIREICAETGQYVPQTRGEVMRCIYESLAIKYAVTVEMFRACCGLEFKTLHVVGGGTKDGLLSQYTANATGLPLIAGPIEATALGNVVVQLITSGEIGSLAEARTIIGNSFELLSYTPKDVESWREAIGRYQEIFG